MISLDEVISILRDELKHPTLFGPKGDEEEVVMLEPRHARFILEELFRLKDLEVIENTGNT